MHDHNLLHRDLKPQNLFVTRSGQIKLGDFGVSRILESECALAKTQTGTPFYFSPELWLDEPYGRKSDIFALGAILYELCMHVPPFHFEDMNDVKDGLCNKEPYPIPPYYSTELRGLISQMMSKDPTQRPDSDAILALPFIRKEVIQLPWGRAQTTPATLRGGLPGGDPMSQSQEVVAAAAKEKKIKKKSAKGSKGVSKEGSRGGSSKKSKRGGGGSGGGGG